LTLHKNPGLDPNGANLGTFRNPSKSLKLSIAERNRAIFVPGRVEGINIYICAQLAMLNKPSKLCHC
jgi:hypothetical protein